MGLIKISVGVGGIGQSFHKRGQEQVGLIKLSVEVDGIDQTFCGRG